MLTSKLIDLSNPRSIDLSLPRRIVFTNGVFDLLHAGHVTYLTNARTLGESLFVAINSDASARRLNKGVNRPINTALDRAIVIAALESVDAVCIFDEDKPCDVMRRIRPDAYVKGGDYDMETLEETALIRSWGGSSTAMPFVSGYSTSSIIHRAQVGSENN
jgi:D-glycero-beta-D-manno-heptose 1-phosphate adenylyltransferase